MIQASSCHSFVVQRVSRWLSRAFSQEQSQQNSSFWYGDELQLAIRSGCIPAGPGVDVVFGVFAGTSSRVAATAWAGSVVDVAPTALQALTSRVAATAVAMVSAWAVCIADTPLAVMILQLPTARAPSINKMQCTDLLMVTDFLRLSHYMKNRDYLQ